MSQDDTGSPRGNAGAAPKDGRTCICIFGKAPENSEVPAQKACEQICMTFVLHRDTLFCRRFVRECQGGLRLDAATVCRV